MQKDICPVCGEYCNPSCDGAPVHNGACRSYYDGDVVALLDYAKDMHMLSIDSSVCAGNARVAVSLAQRLLTQRALDASPREAQSDNNQGSRK
jgi:hypothetical protein